MFLIDISKPYNVLNTAIIVKGPGYPQVVLHYIQQLEKAMSDSVHNIPKYSLHPGVS